VQHLLKQFPHQRLQLPRQRRLLWLRRREAAQSSQRQRAWFCFRDWFLVRLLEYQRACPLTVPVSSSVLTLAFWCFQAAPEFLFFDEILTARVNSWSFIEQRRASRPVQDLRLGSSGECCFFAEERLRKDGWFEPEVKMDSLPQQLCQVCGRGTGVITLPRASIAKVASRLVQSGLCEIVDGRAACEQATSKSRGRLELPTCRTS